MESYTIELVQLAEKCKSMHYDICELLSTMKTQNSLKGGITFKTLREFRVKSNQVKVMDLQIRNLSINLTNFIKEKKAKKKL